MTCGQPFATAAVPLPVIPAKAGIQLTLKGLGPGLRRGDELAAMA